MNKVLTNFRDHHSLRFDPEQLVFKIDDKVYLISESTVDQILPKQIEHTDIGEPCRDLVRLWFKFAEDAENHYMEGIDFAPEHEQALLKLL